MRAKGYGKRVCDAWRCAAASLAWREREHHTEAGEQSQAHLGTAVCCAAPRPVYHHAAPPTYPTLPSRLGQGPQTMPTPMPSSSLTHSTT